jgi:hypothetical protein
MSEGQRLFNGTGVVSTTVLHKKWPALHETPSVAEKRGFELSGSLLNRWRIVDADYFIANENLVCSI